jgi:lysophospholipase L1-like esterase
MRLLRPAALLLLLIASTRAEDFLPGVKRILFLGDSITYAGQYVDLFDTFLLTQFPAQRIEVIDCGLPSETVSGLSEDGHAGGKFPRPDLHERLDRVLATVKPDLVFACYGMNCGIYLPFNESRFARYQSGIRLLREKVTKAGAQIIHLTPPVFDPVPLKGRVLPASEVKNGQQFEGYNGVLDRYSEWLVEQGKREGWRVIDTHSAMAAALAEKRKADPAFTYARDGVHANSEGHRVLAATVIRDLAPGRAAAFFKLLDSDWAAGTQGRTFFAEVRKRGRLLADAHLNAAGHKRPGMAKGLPLDEANAKAGEVEKQLREAVAKIPAN